MQSAFEKISAGLNNALDIVRGYPVVTAQMVEAGLSVFHKTFLSREAQIAAVYR